MCGAPRRTYATASPERDSALVDTMSAALRDREHSARHTAGCSSCLDAIVKLRVARRLSALWNAVSIDGPAEVVPASPVGGRVGEGLPTRSRAGRSAPCMRDSSGYGQIRLESTCLAVLSAARGKEHTMAEITEREQRQIDQANSSGKTPVVFIHGLWLLPSSWDNWVGLFEENGYAGVTPSWPDDPEAVEEARANPEVFARKTLKQVADHTATVAIDPGPFRGVLPLPLSTLKVTGPVLANPRNRGRAITLTFDQFKYGWANALDDEEARQLYDTYHVAGPGLALAQMANANLNPFTEAKVDPRNPARGPLLIIEGEKDHTVPWAIANAAYKRQKHNESVTEITRIPNRGHSLTIDSGWREVAQTALDFVKRFV